jgi:hypothetical protein
MHKTVHRVFQSNRVMNLLFNFFQRAAPFSLRISGGTVGIVGSATVRRDVGPYFSPAFPLSRITHCLGGVKVHTMVSKPHEQSESLLHSCRNFVQSFVEPPPYDTLKVKSENE